MLEVLDYIIKKIVTNSDSVNISTQEDEFSIRYNITVDPTDAALIIGRSGATIKSIQEILIAQNRIHNPNNSRKIYVNIA